MSNPIFKFLKTLEGQTLDNSPSPVSVWLKGKLCRIEPGYAEIEYIIRIEMTNPLGILQGGILAAMMDDTLGVAVYSLGKDKFYTSVNFCIDYLESAKEGDKIIVCAKIIREGNTILNIDCKMLNEEGKIIARGSSNLVAKEFNTGKKLPRF